MNDIEAVRVDGRRLVYLDQTLLPAEERYVAATGLDALCEAIRSLRVRGAPLLGICGAAGIAIAANTEASDAALRQAATTLKATRPTAVELGALAERALEEVLRAGPGPDARREAAWAFVAELMARRRSEDLALAAAGVELFAPGSAVLTHCNTGTLATGGIGTALGVIRAAWEAGRVAHCYATETRPLLQGARLTALELRRLGIPATLLPDTAAAALIASGRVQAVITGADRIAANGDTANKIGTLGLALAAARYGVPFYIAAPRTTFDPACPDGTAIPIEYRHASEVGGFAGQRWAPDGLEAYNPAFDVTPGDLIAAFITERGIVPPPYAAGIARLAGD
jgi:methylthioribose-1-phosphate isomerase